MTVSEPVVGLLVAIVQAVGVGSDAQVGSWALAEEPLVESWVVVMEVQAILWAIVTELPIPTVIQTWGLYHMPDPDQHEVGT